ncbi:MAG TPA: DMT family transporter, partial [Thermoplasmata archaeon]|nr:DMT family transporter [Thermoplasmata archaeon]
IAIGAFLVTTQLRFGDVRFTDFIIGNLMLVAAAACWGASNTLSTILLRRVPIGPTAAVQLLIGAVIFTVILPVAGVPLSVPLAVWPLVVLLSLVAIGGFAILFYYAFRTIGAMRTGAILPTSAFWGILLAIYLFHDTLSEVQIVGGVLMIAAVVALYISRRPAEKASEGETLKPAASDGPDSP